MRLLSRCIPILVAVSLVFVGCDSNLTAPQSNGPETSPQATANAGGPPGGGPPGGGPAGPTCDVTVTPGESIDDVVDNSAQSGDVVCVEDGTYEEQVTIRKDLTLRGLNNPTIKYSPPASSFTIAESGPTWEPIVFAFGGSVSSGEVSGSGTVDVTLKGFTIDGDNKQPDARRLPAVLYRNASGTVSENTVNKLAIGGKQTFGILAYGDSDVDIVGNTVNGYERGGIGANGDGGAHPSPTVKIVDNEVTGSTGIGEAWGPNGIQVGFGAEGQIRGNAVEDNRYSETRGTASCILLFESDNVSVKGNTASNCDVGIGVGTWGWFRETAEGNQIVRNEVSDALFGASLNAIAFGGFTSTDPLLQNNKVTNNSFGGGEIGITGVRIRKVDFIEDDAIEDFDPVAKNNKLIANQITEFATSVDDGGSGTKVQANDRPFMP